jgi:hypothetical protein
MLSPQTPQQRRAQATAQVQAQATQTVAALQARPTHTARARAQAQAAAVITHDALPTSTPSAAQWGQSASQTTYADVNDHPDLHQGDKIVWTCNIAKFLGDDPNNAANTDIGC